MSIFLDLDLISSSFFNTFYSGHCYILVWLRFYLILDALSIQQKDKKMRLYEHNFLKRTYKRAKRC